MGEKDHAPAQFCAIAPAAFDRLPMIVIVWFIIDATTGLVEFMLANAPIASVRFPVT